MEWTKKKSKTTTTSVQGRKVDCATNRYPDDNKCVSMRLP